MAAPPFQKIIHHLSRDFRRIGGHAFFGHPMVACKYKQVLLANFGIKVVLDQAHLDGDLFYTAKGAQGFCFFIDLRGGRGKQIIRKRPYLLNNLPAKNVPARYCPDGFPGRGVLSLLPSDFLQKRF